MKIEMVEAAPTKQTAPPKTKDEQMQLDSFASSTTTVVAPVLLIPRQVPPVVELTVAIAEYGRIYAILKRQQKRRFVDATNFDLTSSEELELLWDRKIRNLCEDLHGA